MAKTIYKKVLNNNVKCSIELLDTGKCNKSDNEVFGYSIGDIGGLAYGDDLLKYIVALETEDFTDLKQCSHNAICFINDLVILCSVNKSIDAVASSRTKIGGGLSMSLVIQINSF